MLTATVVGNVWSTRRLAEIPNGAFLEVEAEGSDARLVAFDVLGTGVGERVLVVQGSVAAAWFPGKAPPIDALIIGSIDEPSTAAPADAAVQASPVPDGPAADRSPPGGTASARAAPKRKKAP
jgi:ethanolamine utilization protein EutN